MSKNSILTESMNNSEIIRNTLTISVWKIILFVGDFKISRSDNTPIIAINNKNIFKILYSDDRKIKHDIKTNIPPENGISSPLFRKNLRSRFLLGSKKYFF